MFDTHIIYTLTVLNTNTIASSIAFPRGFWTRVWGLLQMQLSVEMLCWGHYLILVQKKNFALYNNCFVSLLYTILNISFIEFGSIIPGDELVTLTVINSTECPKQKVQCPEIGW